VEDIKRVLPEVLREKVAELLAEQKRLVDTRSTLDTLNDLAFGALRIT